MDLVIFHHSWLFAVHELSGRGGLVDEHETSLASEHRHQEDTGLGSFAQGSSALVDFYYRSTSLRDKGMLLIVVVTTTYLDARPALRTLACVFADEVLGAEHSDLTDSAQVHGLLLTVCSTKAAAAAALELGAIFWPALHFIAAPRKCGLELLPIVSDEHVELGCSTTAHALQIK